MPRFYGPTAACWAVGGRSSTEPSALAARSLLTLCLFVVSAAVVRLAWRGQCQSCFSFPYQSDWFGSLVPSTLMGLVNWFCIAVALVFCALLSLLLTHQAEVSELN